jgi:epoxyqueuosine reductase QueG
MESLTMKMKKRGLKLGADFIGVASRDRFEGTPRHADPAHILPDYRSVVAYGVAISRGSLKAWFAKRSRRPLDAFDSKAMEILEDIAHGLTRFLEREGYPTCYIKYNDYHNLYDGLKPDFSHKHAAMAAGQGILGLSSMLVHPQYGAAVHLGSVITEGPLEADPMIDVETADPCDHCGYCIDVCPVGAIHPESEHVYILNGREYSHRNQSQMKCFIGCSGYDGHSYQIGEKTVGTWSYNSNPFSTLEEAYQVMNKHEHELRHPMELAEMVIDPELQFCGNCQKICVGAREQKDALFETHLNAGLVPIPDSPTMLVNLEDENYRREPFNLEALDYDPQHIDYGWSWD